MTETQKELSILKRSQFICPKCKGEDGQGALVFFAAVEQMRQEEDGCYVADCPNGCGACDEVWYMRNIRLAQGKQTGPTSDAGKNKVRMNGYRTGSSYLAGAIPKALPPAKPGKYAECDGCHDRDECEQEVKDSEGTCRQVICHRQSEIFAKYRAAHLAGDPEALRLVAADNQARMQLVMNQCFKLVFDEGVMIEHDVIEYNRTTGKRECIGTEKKINPAINEAIKILEKAGFSLADWTLTPRSKEAKAALEGYLAGQAAAKGQSIDEFMNKHNADMKAFHDALSRGNAAVQNDETLKEANAEAQDGGAGA